MTQRIDSLFQGDRFRDEQGNVGTLTYKDHTACYTELENGSRHAYHRHTEVLPLDPEPRSPLLGR